MITASGLKTNNNQTKPLSRLMKYVRNLSIGWMAVGEVLLFSRALTLNWLRDLHNTHSTRPLGYCLTGLSIQANIPQKKNGGSKHKSNLLQESKRWFTWPFAWLILHLQRVLRLGYNSGSKNSVTLRQWKNYFIGALGFSWPGKRYIDRL